MPDAATQVNEYGGVCYNITISCNFIRQFVNFMNLFRFNSS